jgi:hypothetical protein
MIKYTKVKREKVMFNPNLMGEIKGETSRISVKLAFIISEKLMSVPASVAST